jgi:hypothetical protein
MWNYFIVLPLAMTGFAMTLYFVCLGMQCFTDWLVKLTK